MKQTKLGWRDPDVKAPTTYEVVKTMAWLLIILSALYGMRIWQDLKAMGC